MYPSGYRRDLGELQQLAHTLFTELRGRFMVGDSVSVRFDRIDSLADTAIEEEHLVATALLCSQLLHRVTTIPERAQPRHLVTLCDIIDQALTSLLEECRHRRVDTGEIRRAHDRICSLSMNLAVAADPSAPDFSEWI
jgi:hypothetical protein